MKKLLATLAIISLVACGGSTSTDIKNDTTSVTDTTKQKDTSDYKKFNEERLNDTTKK